MADRTIADRLQPALLDRLTDHSPEAATESRDARVIDINRLRDIVRRDLSWLLNTNNLDTQIDPDRYPHVARSVVNFGVREVSGEFSTARRAELIRDSMARAIERFEPRLNHGTLEVVLREQVTARSAIVTYDIAADMWAQPIPLELYLRSEVDVTTGELKLEEER